MEMLQEKLQLKLLINKSIVALKLDDEPEWRLSTTHFDIKFYPYKFTKIIFFLVGFVRIILNEIMVNFRGKIKRVIHRGSRGGSEFVETNEESSICHCKYLHDRQYGGFHWLDDYLCSYFKIMEF